MKSHVAIAVSISMLAAAPAAFAKKPMQGMNSSARQALTRYLTRASKLMSSMSDRQIREYFSYRDAKGNKKSLAAAPQTSPDLWGLQDLELDKVAGTSTERAYTELKISVPATPITVAVIDSGVDVKHEDLATKIFINEKEANGVEGVDDDGNGFVDDVNGWNFLGGKNGDVTHSSLEMTRELSRMKKKAGSGTLSPEEQAYMAELQKAYDASSADYNQIIEIYKSRLTELQTAVEVLKAAGMTEETVEAAEAVKSEDPAVLAARDVAVKYFKNGMTTTSLKGRLEELEAGVKVYFDLDFNPSSIIGDDSSVLNEKGYGNNHVTTETADHGTHCSGIIGAIRNNGVGMNGQAESVRILPVRSVPDGDERDKDIGNAIKYAVDMGARVVSMSFGKSFSPNKAYVDEAVRYAEERGVLLVHAAGNDNSNNDTGKNFPNKTQKLDDATRYAENWLEIGASTRDADSRLPATFSNYGQEMVDLFAPGHQIYSTVPNNQYAIFSGTSMATPEVAGIAALVLTQHPELNAVQLRKLLMDSTQSFKGLMVMQPGAETLVDFATLSVTGGVANALNALKAADRLYGKPVGSN